MWKQSLLREGNVHSAKDWLSVLEPVVARYRGQKLPLYFRADAAFANPEIYEYLEAEGYGYAIRLPANDVLLREIAPLLTRPVGRPSNAPVSGMRTFSIRRRVGIAPVGWWPRWNGTRGELFPRVGFIVTNLSRPAKRVVRFYNQRGTAEQWIKEGKNAVKWTRLSCHDFVDNQVRLQLFVLAYNLGNFLRQAVLPQVGASLDVDDVAGETDQDRGEGRAPFPAGDLPDGGGGGSTRVVPGYSGKDWMAEIAHAAARLMLAGRQMRESKMADGDALSAFGRKSVQNAI